VLLLSSSSPSSPSTKDHRIDLFDVSVLPRALGGILIDEDVDSSYLDDVLNSVAAIVIVLPLVFLFTIVARFLPTMSLADFWVVDPEEVSSSESSLKSSNRIVEPADRIVFLRLAGEGAENITIAFSIISWVSA
jgi:hypothetical protein